MLIKLPPDSISLFWDHIRKGLVSSNRIPDDFAQQYSIDMLKQLLVGDLVCWLGFEYNDKQEKVPKYFITTQIQANTYRGTRTLYINSLYAIVPITKDMIYEMVNGLKPYAIAAGCDVVMADYYTERVKEILLDTGFEPYRSTCRQFIRR